MKSLDDFRFMWRGKIRQTLSKQQAYLLNPVDKRGEGNNTALLLLHGFSSTPAVFRELLPTLTTLYDAVVCPALPGHAESIEAFSQSKAREWLMAAESNYTSLLSQYQVVDVMGLSLGGLLACHLAQKYSLHRLYLLAPALALRIKASCALMVAKCLSCLGFRRLRNCAGNLHTMRSAELAYRQVPIASIIEILTLIQSHQFVLPTCPVELFLGKYDEVVHSDLVAELFSGKPNITIHWLEHSAHVLPLDGDVERILTCVQKNQ